ncbi:hypothetical protein Ciccas_000029 [Cichlidogyrus casuarinus]|uniref:Uncharacterized protein n=1 Tax=Cichlidogyrus casuarinus TaxID=1844966 RepID=A0ABD2QP34_9PLAT
MQIVERNLRSFEFLNDHTKKRISDILLRSKASQQVLMYPAEFLNSLRILHAHLPQEEWVCLERSLWNRDTGFPESLLEIVANEAVFDNNTATIALDYISERGIPFIDEQFEPVDYLELFRRYVDRRELNNRQQNSILDCMLTILTDARKTKAFHDLQILVIVITLGVQVKEPKTIHKMLDLVYDLLRYVFGSSLMMLEKRRFLERITNEWIYLRKERPREMATHILVCLASLFRRSGKLKSITIRNLIGTQRELVTYSANGQANPLNSASEVTYLRLRGRVQEDTDHMSCLSEEAITLLVEKQTNEFEHGKKQFPTSKSLL